MLYFKCALFVSCLLLTVEGAVPKRCHVDESCFPTNEELVELRDSLDGQLFFPTDDGYRLSILHNTFLTKFPIAVASVKSTQDVQRSVRFARAHNLRVTVMSSGHDYNGRSTAHESLMIHLGNMNGTRINLASTRNAAGEITCESGNSWLKVYTELDAQNRVIIGGSAHTVSMGGYTLGGGHSPMSRMFGMAVDNLLEVDMVTANGDLIRANAEGTTYLSDDGKTLRTTNDTDIFWALRGGGGGTFGIVTNFTYRLHHAASAVVHFTCYYPIILPDGTNVGYDILQFIGNLVPNMPREWGGYLLIGGDYNPVSRTRGYIGVSFNHYGDYDTSSRAYMDKIINYKPHMHGSCQYRNVSTFLQYEVTANDALYYNAVLFNVLMQNNSFTPEWVRFTIDHVINDHPVPGSSVGYTGTLLGGKMQEVGTHATAVHPGWRSSLMSLSGGLSFDPNKLRWSKVQDEAKVIGDQQIHFGLGMYPNESGPNVTNWHDNFWGNNYQRLLQIKQQWDPDNFFYCSQCVGSDATHAPNIPSIPHIGFGRK